MRNQNTLVVCQPGCYIDFSWLQVLPLLPFLQRSESDPKFWIWDGFCTVFADEQTLFSHPAKDEYYDRLFIAAEKAATELYGYVVKIRPIRFGQYAIAITVSKQSRARCKTVCFGHYPQKNSDPSNTSPIEWFVLDEQDGISTLVSRHGLCTNGYWFGDPYEAYANGGYGLIWENSEIRTWLNGEFLQTAFTTEEQMQIADTKIETHQNGDKTRTNNHVFLLSVAEALLYLADPADFRAFPTGVAALNGACTSAADGGAAPWWLLPYTDGSIYPTAACPDGNILYHGRNAAHRDLLIRPAIRVRTDALIRTESPETGFVWDNIVVECSWDSEKADSFQLVTLCHKTNALKVIGSHVFSLGSDTRVFVQDRTLVIDGDYKAVFRAWRETTVRLYDHSLSFTKTTHGYVIKLLQIYRDRYRLIEDQPYYLRVVRDDVTILKVTIAKESASESYYDLTREAASMLYQVLQREQGESKSLFRALQCYFATHTDVALCQLMKREKIPFQPFHYH